MPRQGSAGFSANTPFKQAHFNTIMNTHMRIVRSLLPRDWVYPMYFYGDLNAGPGRYIPEHGATVYGSPIIMLAVAQALQLPLHALFCEADSASAQALRRELRHVGMQECGLSYIVADSRQIIWREFLRSHCKHSTKAQMVLPHNVAWPFFLFLPWYGCHVPAAMICDKKRPLTLNLASMLKEMGLPDNVAPELFPQIFPGLSRKSVPKESLGSLTILGGADPPRILSNHKEDRDHPDIFFRAPDQAVLLCEEDYQAAARRTLEHWQHHTTDTIYGLLYSDENGRCPPFDLLGDYARELPKVDLLIHVAATPIKRQYYSESHPLLKRLDEMMATVPKDYWIVREPYYQHQWSFLIGTNWDAFPKFRKQGFWPIDSPEGADILRRLSLNRREYDGQGDLFSA